MKDYLKGALRVVTNYSISLLLFALFFLTLYKYLFVYSLIIFLILFLFIYLDMWKLATKEKRPQYGIKNYPLKGLIYGLIGFSPFVLISLIIPLIPLQTAMVDVGRLKHVAVNTVLSPLFWAIKWGNEQTYAYIISYFIVPVISMLGYMAGHYGFELHTFLRGGNKKVNPALKK